MLINSASKSGSLVFELVVAIVVVSGVGIAVYHMQHPPMTQAQQVQAAFLQ